MSDVVNIGLPFFDNIGKQVRNKPFFNGYLADWKGAANRFLPFQIVESLGAGMSQFDLVNTETGVSVSYLTYFNSKVLVSLVDGEYYYTHLGLVDVSVADGRYYFYAKNASSSREWWSEEFVMCDGIEEENSFLLISKTDYLLIGGTDRLYIR
jgi:hypothetical protein